MVLFLLAYPAEHPPVLNRFFNFIKRPLLYYLPIVQ
jgi:hypothetical protein